MPRSRLPRLRELGLLLGCFAVLATGGCVEALSRAGGQGITASVPVVSAAPPAALVGGEGWSEVTAVGAPMMPPPASALADGKIVPLPAADAGGLPSLERAPFPSRLAEIRPKSPLHAAVTGPFRSGSLPVPASARVGGHAEWQRVATIQFGFASSRLAREDFEILRAIAQLRGARGGGSVHVVGHADRTGTAGRAGERANQLISERRAKNVAEALSALGLPGASVSTEGRGDADPLAAETTIVGGAANRRAEIYFRPDAEAPPIAAVNAPAAVGDLPREEQASTGIAGDSAGSALPAAAEVQPGSSPDGKDEQVRPSRSSAEVMPTACTGCRVPLATLYFGHGSTRLGARERAILNGIAAFQQAHGGEVYIIGHASTAVSSHRGPATGAEANQAVSLARAKAVAKVLAAKGVAAGTMEVVGRGADEPAVAEADTNAAAGNRRVEIYIDLPQHLRLAEAVPSAPR